MQKKGPGNPGPRFMVRRMKKLDFEFFSVLPAVLFRRDAQRVADGGDGFPLEAGGGGQKSAGGSEDDILPLSLPHSGKKIAVQHGGGAAAARAAGVHVLLLPVIEEEAAVLEMLPHVHAVPGEKVPDDGMTQLSQVSGDHQIVVLNIHLTT